MMVGKTTRKTRMDIAATMDKSATAQPSKTGEPKTPPLIIVVALLLLMRNNKRRKTGYCLGLTVWYPSSRGEDLQ